MYRAAIVALLVLFVGCATVPMASDSADRQAKAFSPPPGQAALYVIKDTGLGQADVIRVTVDGQMVGAVTNGTYLLAYVPAGSHRVMVFGQANSDALDIHVGRGECGFLLLRSELTWTYPAHYLNILADSEGRAAVRRSSLALNAGR